MVSVNFSYSIIFYRATSVLTGVTGFVSKILHITRMPYPICPILGKNIACIKVPVEEGY
jgi:hypothetical protein